ncbi:hypothetical protein [Polaribacter sp. R77954]|uniref:hypothetical protein n=1 Tax=Polaribacter sp. R77954 TaxID=3093870 RepID=UPI0037CA1B47
MPKKLHPLVIKTKLELEKIDKENVKTWGERHSYRGTNLPVSVEPKLRPRAFNFMNELLHLLAKNNHSIKIEYNRCHIEMYGQLTKFTLRQKFYRKRIKEEGYSFSRNVFVKSEDLEFKILDYPRKIWIDKKTKNLEDYLIQIYEYIQKKSFEWAEHQKLQKIKEEKREQERILEQEKLRLIAIEKAKFGTLVKSSQDFKLANDIRNYLKELKERMIKEGAIDKKDLEYIKWGRQKADEIDPLINFLDG